MCFSAEASFTAGLALTAAGTVTLCNVRSKKEFLIASFPILFAAQQLIEGTLWLALRGGRLQQFEHGLTFLYLSFAYVFWPLVFPASVYCLETAMKRRKLIFPLILVGFGTSLY